MVTLLLDNGADAVARQYVILSALEQAAKRGHTKIVKILLNHNANIKKKLRYDIVHADIHCLDNEILANMKENFNEALADVLFPYCGEKDYGYFLETYIKARIVAIKSAASLC